MLITLIALLAFIFYLLATGLHFFDVRHKNHHLHIFSILSAVVAVVFHGVYLHLKIDLYNGQNINVFNIISMIFWLASCLTLLSLLRLPIYNIALFLFPLSALSILLILVIPLQTIINTAAAPLLLIHITFSLLTFSFLCIAALVALLIYWQDKRLHKKPYSLSSLFPPLQSMELFLIQTIWIGFILLTLLIISAFFSFSEIFNAAIMSKIFISILAWALYATLLCGHYIAGWRGRIIVRGTLAGFMMLLIAYLCMVFIQS